MTTVMLGTTRTGVVVGRDYDHRGGGRDCDRRRDYGRVIEIVAAEAIMIVDLMMTERSICRKQIRHYDFFLDPSQDK